MNWIKDGLNATSFFILRNIQCFVALACIIILSLIGGVLVAITNYLFFFLLTCG